MKKTALVTASTRGIGWAIARRFAAEGMTVYVSSTHAELEDAGERIRDCVREGMEIRTLEYDAFQSESYKPMIDSIAEQEGRLDVLVNNFGYTNPRKDLAIDQISYDDFESLVTLNLRSVMLPIIYALPMMKQTGGCVINIASIGGKVPDMTQVAYGSAKAAICHITKMAAVQLASSGIRCNAILPGIVATDAVRRALTPEYRQFFLRHVPLGRMAEPDEIGDTALFLATNAYVTGQLLEVTGGFGMATPLYADMTAAKAKQQR